MGPNTPTRTLSFVCIYNPEVPNAFSLSFVCIYTPEVPYAFSHRTPSYTHSLAPSLHNSLHNMLERARPYGISSQSMHKDQSPHSSRRCALNTMGPHAIAQLDPPVYGVIVCAARNPNQEKGTTVTALHEQAWQFH